MRRAVVAVLFLGLAGAAFWFWAPQAWRDAALPWLSAQAPAPGATSGDRQESAPGGGRGQGQGAGRGPAAGGVPVETSKALATTTTSDIRAVGSLNSDESVMLAPEVAGRVAAIPFVEGKRVNAGDVILKLDDALVRAELADAEARFRLAKANMDRANELARTGNVTERARDEATSSFGIAAAAVELAKVRVSKTTITAPFSGVVGIRNTSVGAYLAVGTRVVNLEKIDPLKVDFSVPEIYLAAVGVGQEVEVSVDAIANRTFVGTIQAIDPMVDVNGRSLTIRARLPNPDGVLRPGLFARVTIKGLVEREVVMVPESAVVPRAGETFIFRIENGKAVESKVKLGERRAGQVAIVEGLPANATVVTAGHQRLRNGSVVDVVSAGATPERQGG